MVEVIAKRPQKKRRRAGGRKMFSRHRIAQHLQHFRRTPFVFFGVVVVDHPHHLQVHASCLQGLQESLKLGIFVGVQPTVGGYSENASAAAPPSTRATSSRVPPTPPTKSMRGSVR